MEWNKSFEEKSRWKIVFLGNAENIKYQYRVLNNWEVNLIKTALNEK